MSSLDPIPTTLSDHLRQLGLVHTATELNDLVASATQKRWSPVVLLEHLAKAIELSPRNRIQARSDSDFQDMADDPRFTELLYKYHISPTVSLTYDLASSSTEYCSCFFIIEQNYRILCVFIVSHLMAFDATERETFC